MMRSFAPLLLAASACMVGPNFTKPKVELNASWSESKDPRLRPNAAANIEWWKTFNDPTLDQLIDLAYQQNLSLQAALLRIDQARALVGLAVGNQWPQGGPSASGTTVRLSSHGPGSFLPDRRFSFYDVGFDATWEIDLWGKYRRAARAARAEYQAAISSYDDVLVSVTAEVARTYIEVRRFETLIALAQQNEAVQAEGLQIAESRFRNGATSELDVAQAKNLLETTRASIPKLQLGLVQTHNALSTLLGRPTGFVRTLLATPAAIPAPPAQVAISVPGEMLRRRPDIRAAEMRARAQCERIGVAKADYYPNFNLFGFVGTQTSTGANNGSTFTDLFASGSLFGFAGGNLLLPLLNYKRIHSNVQLQDALYRQLLVDYVDTVLRAAQEVEDNMTGYLRQQDAEVFEQNAVDAADNAVKLALTMYREGATDYERVLQTQRALLESQNELADTRASVITNLIALYKALGGGWEIRLQPPRGR